MFNFVIIFCDMFLMLHFVFCFSLLLFFCLPLSLCASLYHGRRRRRRQQQAPSDISKLNSNGIERLKKRIGQYRHHHAENVPRFDQSFSGACEQQSVETVILQKRFLENKAKKAAKKVDKKQPENSSLAGNLQSSVHVVSIFSDIKLQCITAVFSLLLLISRFVRFEINSQYTYTSSHISMYG